MLDHMLIPQQPVSQATNYSDLQKEISSPAVESPVTTRENPGPEPEKQIEPLQNRENENLKRSKAIDQQDHHSRKTSAAKDSATEESNSRVRSTADDKPSARNALQNDEKKDLLSAALQQQQHIKQSFKSDRELNSPNTANENLRISEKPDNNNSLNFPNQKAGKKNLEARLEENLPQKTITSESSSEKSSGVNLKDFLKEIAANENQKPIQRNLSADNSLKNSENIHAEENLNENLAKSVKKSGQKNDLHARETLANPDQVVSRETIRSGNAAENGNITNRQENFKPENIVQYRSTENLNKKIDTENLSSRMETNLNFQNNSADMGFDRLMQTQRMKESPVMQNQFRQQVDQMFARARIILRENGNANLTTNLYPKELGKISIRLALLDGKLTGLLTVDNEIVQKELHELLEKVIEDLKKDGYEVSHFDVNVRSENGEQTAQNAKQGAEGFKQAYKSSSRSIETAATATTSKTSGGLYA